MDTCNAMTREAGRPHICERPLRHAGDHRDGDYTWPQGGRGPATGDVVLS